jgi:hypothetical protein
VHAILGRGNFSFSELRTGVQPRALYVRSASGIQRESQGSLSSYAPRMGTLTYGDKRKHIPLQVVDNLVYETMKLLLNQKYDSARPERIAMQRMKAKIGSIRLFNQAVLESLIHTHN